MSRRTRGLRSVRLGAMEHAQTKALALCSIRSWHARSGTSPVRYMPGVVGLSFSRVFGLRGVHFRGGYGSVAQGSSPARSDVFSYPNTSQSTAPTR
jgi:hypothetical protein